MPVAPLREASRPWGSFRTLFDRKPLPKDKEGYGAFHVKILTLQPGKRISLQTHNHRAEVWVVVQGTGIATLGNIEQPISRGSSVKVWQFMEHRLTNSGFIPLVIVEVQVGEECSEDDIVRIQDDWGRAG